MLARVVFAGHTALMSASKRMPGGIAGSELAVFAPSSANAARHRAGQSPPATAARMTSGSHRSSKRSSQSAGMSGNVLTSATVADTAHAPIVAPSAAAAGRWMRSRQWSSCTLPRLGAISITMARDRVAPSAAVAGTARVGAVHQHGEHAGDGAGAGALAPALHRDRRAAPPRCHGAPSVLRSSRARSASRLIVTFAASKRTRAEPSRSAHMITPGRPGPSPMMRSR